MHQNILKYKILETENLLSLAGDQMGLLVGATLIQNPDYFGATLPAVGVLDMLRFTEFTEGWGWRGDYGSPLINEYDFIRGNLKISPYHQIKVDECYSPTLTTTGRRMIELCRLTLINLLPGCKSIRVVRIPFCFMTPQGLGTVQATE